MKKRSTQFIVLTISLFLTISQVCASVENNFSSKQPNRIKFFISKIFHRNQTLSNMSAGISINDYILRNDEELTEEIHLDYVAEEEMLTKYMEGASCEFDKQRDLLEEIHLDYVAEEEMLTKYMEGNS